MHACVCVAECMHTWVYACMYLCMHVGRYICRCAFMYACTCTCGCMCVCIWHLCTCIHACKRVPVCMQLCVCIYIYTSACRHVRMQIYKCMSSGKCAHASNIDKYSVPFLLSFKFHVRTNTEQVCTF